MNAMISGIVCGRPRVDRRGEHVEGPEVLLELRDQALREPAGIHSQLLGARDDLVVDVGVVDDVPHGVAAPLEVAPDDVEDDGGHRVADVRAIVDGDAADVDANAARLDRLERLRAASLRVVDPETHEFEPSLPGA